ncbi:hypothetical protein DMH04_18270 [Kibdelosporangium aridum]|uniref:Uncharacterized protein n=1 Tax=Kibdelosporangium aridum TaxID=2030 RepID=A0A428ZB08_KIBAR|nr:hypothetical protein [Kibdelosporangium aridum]RSM85236.1 hypothetical protein DMH04_18270 [Kibdelosporangium aridum]
MSQTKREDDRLYVAKVVAAGITTVLLGGLLYIAVDRDMNHPYIPFVGAGLLVVLAGVAISVARRISRRVGEKLDKAKPGLLATIFIGGAAVFAVRAVLRLIRRLGAK